MKKHVIVAPHADDEIIGCHSVLVSGTVDIVVFPQKSEAFHESYSSQDVFKFDRQVFQDVSDLKMLAELSLSKGGLMFFPDPVYELHPLHRTIGGIGQYLAFHHKCENIVFYSTNMNAPYIREVVDPLTKHTTLDSCYREKSDLWKYDHKYFLFEGQTMWLINPSWED